MRLSPLRIVLLYAGLAALWILFSDEIVYLAVRDLGTRTTVSILKGWAFVAVTGLLLLVLVRRLLAQVERARRDAAAAAERARRLIDASGIAIISFELDGTIVSWNPAAERMFGWTAAEAIGQESLWVPEDEITTHRELITSLATGATPSPTVMRRRHRDGSTVWVRVFASAMRDLDGRTLCVGSLEDVTHQIEADREREAAAEWNRVMFERNPLPMFVIEPGSRGFLDVNDSAIAAYGWSRAQFLGTTLDDQLAPDGHDAALDRLSDPGDGAVATGERSRYLRADGSWVEVEISGRPVTIGGRRLWLAIIQDVSEREAAEQRRQVLLDRLEALHSLDAEILRTGTLDDVARRAVSRIRQLVPADRASVTVFDRDMDTVSIVAVDERRLLGRPAGTILPTSDAFPVGGHDRPARTLTPDLQAVVAPTDEPSAVRNARRHGLRSVLSIPLLANGVPLGQLNLTSLKPFAFEPDSVAVAAELADSLAIALQQARYRQELLESEARLRSVLAASPNATLLIDAAGLIQYANAVTTQTLGETPEALLGQSIDKLVPLAGRIRHAAMRSVYRPVGSVTPGLQLDGIARRRDGLETPINLTLSPLATPEGPMVVATIIDLTERTALENQFRQAQKMEVMGQFANIMAHDFRNYLTAIGGFAEILAADIDPDDPRHADVEEIIKAVTRASDLVRNVLAFARPDRGAADPATTEIATHLEDVRAMLVRLVEPHVGLVVEVAPDLPAAAIGPAALTQVLVNLTTNARDAMWATGGTVRICASTAEVAAGDPGTPEFQVDRRVHVLVADTGTGMDEPTRSRIFEPFFTTKVAGEGDGKGSGLGLASVFSIVRRAQGRIEVRSEVGVGTSFLIDLPAA